jgi:hypothetical protein
MTSMLICEILSRTSHDSKQKLYYIYEGLIRGLINNPRLLAKKGISRNFEAKNILEPKWIYVD